VAGKDQGTRRYLQARPEKCTGCRVCEMVCSLKHEGASSPLLSRVRVVKVEEWNYNYPAVCAACSHAPCVRVCPTGACYPAPEGVGVRIDESRCIGCRECLVACPFGAVAVHPQRQKAFVCDMCEGDPACVTNCVAGAIEVTSPEALATTRRLAKALAGLGTDSNGVMV
jgi:anaerobic carbon-monoxide dehydrogenase iron sulfur subunit